MHSFPQNFQRHRKRELCICCIALSHGNTQFLSKLSLSTYQKATKRCCYNMPLNKQFEIFFPVVQVVVGIVFSFERLKPTCKDHVPVTQL